MRSCEVVFSPTIFRAMVDVFVAKMQCGGQAFSISLKIDCFSGIFSITAYKQNLSEEDPRTSKERSQQNKHTEADYNFFTQVYAYYVCSVYVICKHVCIYIVLRTFSKRFSFLGFVCQRKTPEKKKLLVKDLNITYFHC